MNDKETITEIELLRMLSERLANTNACAGVQITQVIDEGEGDWRFDIPPGTTAICRGTIIREQAALRLRYELRSRE